MKRLSVSLMVVLLFSAYTTVSAQEAQTTATPYWYVSSYKIPGERIDSMRTLVKMYIVPVVAQAKKMGRLLDYRVLIHKTGGEYTVVIMEKYPSWAAIEKGWNDLLKVADPDEAKRKTVQEGLNWVFQGVSHVDNVYTEATDPR